MAVINQLTGDSNFLPHNSVVFIAKIIFWTACIVFVFLCLIPTAYLSSELFDWWDKAQHVITFFFLNIIGTLAYQKFITKMVTGLFIYGGLIEIIQFLTSWRSCDFKDWLADGIGILIGGAFMRVLSKKNSNFQSLCFEVKNLCAHHIFTVSVFDNLPRCIMNGILGPKLSKS